MVIYEYNTHKMNPLSTRCLLYPNLPIFSISQMSENYSLFLNMFMFTGTNDLDDVKVFIKHIYIEKEWIAWEKERMIL